jgi:hypothetical protein
MNATSHVQFERPQRRSASYASFAQVNRRWSADLFFRSAAFGGTTFVVPVGAAVWKLSDGRGYGSRFRTIWKAAPPKKTGVRYLLPS